MQLGRFRCNIPINDTETIYRGSKCMVWLWWWGVWSTQKCSCKLCLVYTCWQFLCKWPSACCSNSVISLTCRCPNNSATCSREVVCSGCHNRSEATKWYIPHNFMVQQCNRDGLEHNLYKPIPSIGQLATGGFQYFCIHLSFCDH